jgi:hypothetical protein
LIEAVVPKALVTVEPFVGVAHGLGLQSARDRAAGLGAGDEAGIRQHVEMFHHRR